MSDFFDYVFVFLVGFFSVFLIFGFILFVFTYPSLAESNAEFLCESHNLVVKDFSHDRGDLVSVECEDSPVVVKDGFYWERDLD